MNGCTARASEWDRFPSLHIAACEKMTSRSRLEQFDEISRRILQEDLLAAGPGHDVVAELSAGET
jgi:hypothetical protein